MTLRGAVAGDEDRHRAEFYRMWHASAAAGFTHARALDVMGPRASARIEDTRRWLLAGLSRGRDLTTLVRSGGARFDDFERELIPLGEQTGKTEDTLRQLADFFARKHALTLKVRSKMAYPLFTLLAACFVAPLPLLFAGNIRGWLLLAFGGVAVLLVFANAVVAAVAARYGRKPPLARARMARALSTAVSAGLTTPTAIRLSAGASANDDIQRFVAAIDERRLATASMSESLAGCPHMTPEFHALLATAERTGDFSALHRLAELYEDGFR